MNDFEVNCKFGERARYLIKMIPTKKQISFENIFKKKKFLKEIELVTRRDH